MEAVEPVALPIKEVARRLGVSESHVRNMINSSELPSIRLGRRISVPMFAITELVESARQRDPARP